MGPHGKLLKPSKKDPVIGPTVYERTCADDIGEIQKQTIISQEKSCAKTLLNRVEKGQEVWIITRLS